jgi:hypothetical protein
MTYNKANVFKAARCSGKDRRTLKVLKDMLARCLYVNERCEMPRSQKTELVRRKPEANVRDAQTFLVGK